MPKDYIRLKMTGELETDESDASATGIFDVESRIWADEVIARLKLPRSIFPKTNESIDLVGHLTKDAATELGLAPGIPISAGSSDQPAQAVGNGLIDPPLGSVTIGTGGQVFVPLTNRSLIQTFGSIRSVMRIPRGGTWERCSPPGWL